ncbi:MAG: universal stress protein [Gammaproteobacteria bacterium]
MKLLVATDFSPSSTELMRVASNLARGLAADIQLLHVAQPQADLIGEDRKNNLAGSERSSDKQETRLMEKAIHTLKADGLSAAGEIVAGPCADVILARADELGVDMIVVGSHGFGVVLRVLLGSVSAEILKKAHCPVVVVPTGRSR